ncbi:MAG: HAD-IIA family hydrolase [Desulfobacteraceae bacterium]|nr:MAG: HAD-IIA family hydrolase [Desulfobacteraceae bacterium]
MKRSDQFADLQGSKRSTAPAGTDIHMRNSLKDWLERHSSELGGIILDIDGVLLNSGRRLPGSRTLLQWLRRHGMPYVLLTNDGNHSTEEKAETLQHSGLPVSPGQIVSCGHAIVPLVQANGFTGQAFFVMGDTGDPCYARAAGLAPVRELARLKQCAGVIVGEDHYAWEPVINAVVNFFIDWPQAALIVPNPDEFYPGHTFKIHIAAGAVARFIQRVLEAYGLKIEPIYLGKPYPPIFKMAHRHLEQQRGSAIPADTILMVGDNLNSDIAGGRKMAFRTALLLTGVTTPSVLAGAGIRPGLVFEKL